MPFGVRVQSKEDPAGSTVEEGSLEIAVFSDTGAELVPRTSRGSTRARHDLAVDNRGNAKLNATIQAEDPDKLLSFDVNPPSVVADPGTAAFARISVKPKQRFLRGPSKTRAFQVQLVTPGQPPVTVAGTLLQESVLPPWFLRALLAVIAVGVALVLLWVFLLQPAVQTAATDRADQVLASAGIKPPGPGATPPAAATPAPTTAAGGATPTPAVSQPPATSVTGTATPTPIATPTPTATPGFATNGTPRDGRVIANSGPISPTAGKSLYLTDLIFSNPDSTGTVTGEVDLVRVLPDTSTVELLVLQLETFRDLDFHFVTPIVIQSGQSIELVCPAQCGATAVYFSGFEQ